MLLRESQERGDLYAASILTTLYMTMIKLAGNEPIETESELEAVVDRAQLRVHPPAFLIAPISHSHLSLSG